ncbi:P-loop containing nucleoside triphosphate hydrolase protein [Kockiozyma suomiensis]|uniref:P-loop containing nucleoside triphosphate hydrolase protein n=1 Tax=Kockiozyma suomiensis TaxID=1337062 RepID=UPI0033433AED
MIADAKVVLLGAQGAGKTSLVVRYVHNTFHDSQPTTIGASFLAKKIVIDGVVVRLQIWDTAGQERFRSMAPMYYRSAVCGILCYDITSESSFDAMHSWLLELKANLNSDIIIHFVGTKLDLVHKDPSRRAVPYEKCVQYAEKWLRDSEIVANPNWTGRDSCHEICAKDDEGVNDVFESITRTIIKRRPILKKSRRNSVHYESDSFSDDDEADAFTGTMRSIGSVNLTQPIGEAEKSRCC